MFDSLLAGWSLPFPNNCLMIGTSLCEEDEKRQGRVYVYHRIFLLVPSMFLKKKLSSGWSLPSVIVTRLFRSTELRDKSSSLKVLIFFSEECLILVVVYHSSYDWKHWLRWTLKFLGYFSLCCIDEKRVIYNCCSIYVWGYPREYH